MLVLGIDPGTATTGFGLIKIAPHDLIHINHGLIETSKEKLFEKRLHTIHLQLSRLIEDYSPDVMVMEKVFFSVNRKTAIRVSQAQGVILLTAGLYQVPVVEYAPGTIKKMVAGNGRSNKKEVQEAVKNIFDGKVKGIKGKMTHYDNEADALAVALCHIFTSNENEFINNLFPTNV